MTDPSLTDLTSALDALALPVDGPVLCGALALRSRLDAALVRAIVEFDASGLWGPAGDGHRSLIDWVANHGQLTRPEAQRLVRLARLAATAPVMLAAWDAGQLSSGQVAVIAAHVPRPLRARFAADEDWLIPALIPLDVPGTRAAMSHWAVRARHAAGIDPPDPDRDRSAYLEPTLDGTSRLVANLSPDAAVLAETALRKAEDPPSAHDERSNAQRRHDALVHVMAFYLDHSDRHSHSHHRPHLNVLVDHDVLTSGVGTGTDLTSGLPLSAESIRQIACDANLHRVYRSGSTVLDYGRSTRTIPAPLFTAVAIRDGACRGPGCCRPVSQTRGHHLEFWEDGGETCPDNIILLCAYHHWLVHKRRWSVALSPDGTATWTDRVGRQTETRPHPRSGGGPDDLLAAG